MVLLHLYFDVATCWEREVGQRVDGLWRWVGDVDEALVNAHLELLAALFEDVWTFDHSKEAAAGGQRDRPSDGSTSAKCSVYDLLGSLVDDLVVIRL